MTRKMLKSKIHRATVTEANIEYEGSMTIDSDLLRAADILPYEEVDIWDCTNGARISTYAIEGEPGSREICVNGAAAHLIRPGDKVILAAYTMVPEDEINSHQPQLIFVNEANRVVRSGPEVPGPQRRNATKGY